MSTEKTVSPSQVTRRDLLRYIAAGIGGVAVGSAGMYYAGPTRVVEKIVEKKPEKAEVPTSPIKLGIQTIFKGAGAVLGEPLSKGVTLAVEEINAEGGLLGKRKIDLIARDESTADDSVKEYRRLVLEDKINYYIGIISSGVTPAIGPVAEELGMLTIFVDGCTDFLFERAVPKPHFVFRTTNIQSADGVTAAIGASRLFPKAKRIAHINPDYAYGRNAFDHFRIAISKLLPDSEIVYEGWPALHTETEFSPHLTKIVDAKPDLLFSSLWGGQYLTFYRQALAFGVFSKMNFASAISFGVAPHAIGPDHPEGTVAGVHANYYFTYPPWEMWPLNKNFVASYFKRFNEYPNFEAEGGYTSTYALKAAIEKAFKLTGRWPELDDIIATLEGLRIAGPAGYYHYRPENHQAYHNAVTGVSKKVSEYGFPILTDIIHLPIERLVAPPGWKGEPTGTFDWISKTWPKGIKF